MKNKNRMVEKFHQCSLLIKHSPYPKHYVPICDSLLHSLNMPDRVVFHDMMNRLGSHHAGYDTVHRVVRSAWSHFLASYMLLHCDIPHTNLSVLTPDMLFGLGGELNNDSSHNHPQSLCHYVVYGSLYI